MTTISTQGQELIKRPIAVEVGGVVHQGHYSTRNGMIRVTYGSSCQATQLGEFNMENAPKALARMILYSLPGTARSARRSAIMRRRT